MTASKTKARQLKRSSSITMTFTGIDTMNNDITEWSYDKPTEPGLYLVCRGDVEAHANIESFIIVDNLAGYSGVFPEYTADQLEAWHDSFKFARLCVGSECAG